MQTESITGSAHALAVWFGGGRDVSEAHHDFDREEILQDVARCSAWGESGDGKYMIVHGAKGRTMVEFDRPCEGLVYFEHAIPHTWGLTGFWMNLSSVKPLLDRIRTHVLYADAKGDFTELAINELRP